MKDENELSMKVFQEAMIQSCVEVAVRETKRQCRIHMISTEHNTSVRITDDVSLLNWIPHFAMHFLNKMRTGRRRRKPMVQFGEKFWFHKIGEESINSSVKRRIQGIFLRHHDRTRAIPYIAKSGVVRGQSWTRQTLSDAWESTIREDLFGNPGHRRLHTAIEETKLTKKLITDEEGTDRLLPRIVAEKPLEVERRRFYVLSADIEAHGHRKVVRDTRCLHCREK